MKETDAYDDTDQVSVQLVTPFVRGLRLLRYIAEGGSTSNLSRVGRLIDVNRVTVMRLLATLEHEGLIERLPQGGHQIGWEFLTMAASSLASHDIFIAGQRVLKRLSQELEVSAYLTTLEGNEVVYVAREMPEVALVSNIRVGSRVPAYLTAPGRAMLAALSSAKLEGVFQGYEFKPNRQGWNDLAGLTRVLEQDNLRGCVWSFSGYEAGINACASAVLNRDHAPIAALSVVGPEQLFTVDAAFQSIVEAAVKNAARELSRIISP